MTQAQDTAVEIPYRLGPAADHEHTHTVVFLHGRGDNAQNILNNGLDKWRDSQNRNLSDVFPTFRWVIPQAPARQLASLAFDPQIKWPQWFDVWNTRDFRENEELQAVGLKEVVPEFRQILANEAEQLCGRWDRIILAGISMGAATSLHILFNIKEPLAAFMGLSCRLPFAGRSLAEMREILALDDVPSHDDVIRKTPVLLEHCATDDTVPIQLGRALRDTLKGFGTQVEWKEYPTGGHWFHSPNGMDDAVVFLERHVMSKRNGIAGI
ncbi:phospholipase/carboxylesterase family protein [Xylariaceae sp. FL0255]|nr:phospholipase/carboxylesterase family protein [Xylariaceae sp. FL0255]